VLKEKKIVITGALGLIGKELLKIFCKTNQKIYAVDLQGQLNRYADFIKNIKMKNKNIHFIDCDINSNKFLNISKNASSIIHLAAVLGVENTEKNIKKCWNVNALGTKNILQACKLNHVNHIIFSSSSEVYGEQIYPKIDENHPLLGKNIYAMSKIASENFITEYKKRNKNFNYNILRLFNTYGMGQVAKFFITKSCYNLRKNKKIIINGNGLQMRSYSYAFDTANYIYLCWKLRDKVKNQIFNIGNSQEKYNLTQLLKIISSISKKKIKFKIDKSFYKTDRIKEREIFNRLCDNRKSVNKLKYRPKINIYEGIKKVLSQNKIYSDWPK
jgi:nucleoside-diphosphate-sugar epimerase